MSNIFDEANKATEELFESYPDSDNPDSVQEDVEEVVEEPTEEPIEETTEPTEEVVVEPTPEEATLNDAVNTAEVAAQVAQEKDTELQQVLQELEALRAQNQQMQGTINELSQRNEENLIEEAMQPPVLDINGLAFADEATIAQAHADFAQKMADYNRHQIMKELAPTLEYAKKGMQDEERSKTLSALSQVPELQGINDMLPQLDKIIANNKWLQSDDMPMEEKYINAFAIARGVNAINTPPVEQKEPTAEELMELYDKNPTFQELIEKKRLDAIKQSQQVPPFSASSGAVNAALNIKEKPKTFEEASERTRRMFGLD
jgi:hypothetical protein